MESLTLQHFLTLSAVLFSLGVFGVMTRRNTVVVLMGIELILNAANINLVAFSRFNSNLDGQMMAIFIILLAAAEAAIALAIILNVYANYRTVNLDEIDQLKE
ncbi:MAG: NADH-quinone oxidoreductase subunit NuoK [Bacteroidetes bacterium]|nr:NADH-quinone oxidoreductase subunit NuoK [Bacteroidota bacterium]